MIKVIVICIFSLITYLSLSSIDQLNNQVTISFQDYTIEASLICIILTVATSMLALVTAINISTLFFNLPQIIKDKIKANKSQKTNLLLIQAAIFLLINDKNKAKQLSNKISSDVKEYIELKNLILAESEENLDRKLDYYQKLKSSKDCEAFAIRKLAATYFTLGSFAKAEDFASKGLAIDEKDIATIEILVNCYAQQKAWTKYDDSIAKLKKFDHHEISKISPQLAIYYMQAAKEMLEKGEDNKAIHFVESALELNPSNNEALDLYTSINLSLNNGHNNLKILSSAFSYNPSFEIAVMYIHTSTQSAQQIYNDLSTLVDSTDLSYKSLFLAIKAYLNLHNDDHESNNTLVTS
ncbi:MAG: hypothetical protein EOP33_05030 [Rickettsiaceae bacterium]|nr:MAG: hypothetical protein EOP33_05030 [Rickettsiaceae bacterium]